MLTAACAPQICSATAYYYYIAGRQTLAFHSGDEDSWWMKWHWTKLFSEFFPPPANHHFTIVAFSSTTAQ
jgi:hypothetical protein